MFSLDELNQPVAVGPVGQPFTTGPVGTHERVSDCKQMERIADSPVGSTGILDPAKQTESPIQIDFMKIGTINEPASLDDTPPSSDSGVLGRTVGKYEYKFYGYGIGTEREADPR